MRSSCGPEIKPSSIPFSDCGCYRGLKADTVGRGSTQRRLEWIMQVPHTIPPCLPPCLKQHHLLLLISQSSFLRWQLLFQPAGSLAKGILPAPCSSCNLQLHCNSVVPSCVSWQEFASFGEESIQPCRVQSYEDRETNSPVGNNDEREQRM